MYWYFLFSLLVILIILEKGQELLEGNLLVRVFVDLVISRSFIGDGDGLDVEKIDGIGFGYLGISFGRLRVGFVFSDGDLKGFVGFGRVFGNGLFRVSVIELVDVLEVVGIFNMVIEGSLRFGKTGFEGIVV